MGQNANFAGSALRIHWSPVRETKDPAAGSHAPANGSVARGADQVAIELAEFRDDNPPFAPGGAPSGAAAVVGQPLDDQPIPVVLGVPDSKSARGPCLVDDPVGLPAQLPRDAKGAAAYEPEPEDEVHAAALAANAQEDAAAAAQRRADCGAAASKCYPLSIRIGGTVVGLLAGAKAGHVAGLAIAGQMFIDAKAAIMRAVTKYCYYKQLPPIHEAHDDIHWSGDLDDDHAVWFSLTNREWDRVFEFEDCAGEPFNLAQACVNTTVERCVQAITPDDSKGWSIAGTVVLGLAGAATAFGLAKFTLDKWRARYPREG